MRRNLGDLIDLKAHGAIDAFIDLRLPDQPQRWTRPAFNARINGIASGLLAAGYKAGDVIAILSDNRAEFAQAYLATMQAGMISLPVNYRLPAETIRYIFKDAGVKAAFYDADHAHQLPEGSYQRIGFDQSGPEGLASFLRAPTCAIYDPRPDDIAKILYTSGSTGLPKGVMLGHAGQLWALDQFIPVSFPSPGVVAQIVAPTYHKNGLFNTMSCLAGGATIVSLPRFDARQFLRAIASQKAQAISGIPTMFAIIAQETELIASLDLSSVTSVVIGSAPLTQALIDRVKMIFPKAMVLNGYGTTEAGAAVFGVHPQGLARPSLALGYPLAEVDWDLRDGPHPQEGTLFMRTPAMMNGYLNLESKTREKLKDGWYNTGDIMRRDDDGFFYFVGRADDMFVCGGENIFPGEVEKLLERHPAVLQAAVVPAPDDIKGQIPVAFVVAETTVDEAALKAFALDHGPAYSHPRFIRFVETIPVAGTHKVDRRVLIDEAARIARESGRATSAGLAG